MGTSSQFCTVQILTGLHTHSHLAQKRAARCSGWGLRYRPYLHGSVPGFFQSHSEGPRCCGAAAGAGQVDNKEGILPDEGAVDPCGPGCDLSLWSRSTFCTTWTSSRWWRPRRWRTWSKQCRDYRTRSSSSRRRTNCWGTGSRTLSCSRPSKLHSKRRSRRLIMEEESTQMRSFEHYKVFQKQFQGWIAPRAS